MVTAPDGSLWFTDFLARTPKISHVTTDGALTEFPVPINDKIKTVFIASIVVGPDGAIWFDGNDFDGTDYTNFIARMTTDGVFTQMPVPPGLLLGILFTGPDGGLWFSGFRPLDNGSPPAAYRAVYGKIASDGHITEYPYQGSPGSIESLCVGPDKAIWYAVLDPVPVGSDYTHLTGHIVRVSSSGQVQEFAAPHGPNSIASGSDGALWFSEYSEFIDTGGALTTVARKGVIGHITTAGVASEIPIDPNLGADQLVAGSEGAIWFTVDQDDTGKFGRITPSGGVKTFTTGGNSALVKIAAAPGALWLLDKRNNLWHYRLSA
jgi:virginiamycin B lyase